MTAVRSAMARYTIAAADQERHLDTERCQRCLNGRECRIGRRLHQAVEAASLTLDLAVSEASIERTRRAIPW